MTLVPPSTDKKSYPVYKKAGGGKRGLEALAKKRNEPLEVPPEKPKVENPDKKPEGGDKK